MTDEDSEDRMGRAQAARFVLSCMLIFFLFSVIPSGAAQQGLMLHELINDALKNNPEILAAEARSAASGFRVPQAGSLPDPMVMFGYQNEGWKKYTYGEMEGAQWMFTASQMIPYPGKLGLKSEMARQDADSRKAMIDAVRLQVIAKIKSLYYDLFLAYKNIDLIRDRAVLFERIEDAAVARYAAGMGMQQEILMAQTEKYMLLEKEEMQKQKIQSAEAMLNATTGRDINAPVERPAEFSGAVSQSIDGLLGAAFQISPEVRSKEKMIAAAEAKVAMAKREYYPDFTVNAGYANRGGGQFQDMWSLTTTINVPLFYRTKQRQAVLEAEAELLAAKHELEATRLMIASGLRDNYSMYKSAERLIELYNSGLIPKAYQDFESAISGYASGKIEAITAINRLKTLIDLEISYWGQRMEMEKALARCEAIAGLRSQDPEVRSQGDKEK